MSTRQVSGFNTIDPVTGIPVILGGIRVLQDGSIRVTQTTGEPPGGLNQEPGTSPYPPNPQDIGLPYQFINVPETGPGFIPQITTPQSPILFFYVL